MINIGSYYTIGPFTAEEEEDLKTFLIENVYPEGKEGIKQVLLDWVYEDLNEKEEKEEPGKKSVVIEKLLQEIQDNPQAIKAVGNYIRKKVGF